MQERIRIGTRRSRLSLWQANQVAALIRARYPGCRVEIREFSTRGDLEPATPLPKIGGKGLFTEALEAALRRGEIDCAAHSLKDLPVDFAADLALGAVLERGDPSDALVSRFGETLERLPMGARVGTGSLRRRAQLLALRPDLEMRDIRGNVPGRVERLFAADGRYDAIVLALAGLERLEMRARVSQVFDAEQMLPAAGQGALAVQCRADAESLALFAPLNHQATVLATTAERALLAGLEGGCSLPVAAWARVQAERLLLQGRIVALDGARQIDVAGEAQALEGEAGLSSARRLGLKLAVAALQEGAGDILEAIHARDAED